MDTSKAEDEKKFNETLQRMLKTPPDHKTGKGKKPVAPDGSKDSEGVPAGCSAPDRPTQS